MLKYRLALPISLDLLLIEYYDSLDPKQPILPTEDCAGLLWELYS